MIDAPSLSPQKDVPADKAPVSGPPSSLDFSTESLDRLNHSGSSSGSLYPDAVSGGRRGDGHAEAGRSEEDRRGADEPSSSSRGPDAVGSLSDSLYDSFSSCTSQGSNEV